MTGMAQGADLLVARAAVKAGCKVDAVLPMPLDRYVQDFDAESGAALKELLADPAVHCTVLPPPPGADHDAKHGDGRAVFYANLTQALAAKCNRSEEHTSELQSQSKLVCRLLLEKKNSYNRIFNQRVIDRNLAEFIDDDQRVGLVFQQSVY